ncbi:MAG: NADH-quinone oxidoreductase subunit G [Pseudoalteromonas tetraodonis]|jgi:NADH-quinone oxidoreductase subunit G
MIEACRQAEIEVPHYCYHPKLTSPGNCRMCLVEMGMPPRLAPGQEPEFDDDGHQPIGWMPRPVIACANTIAEGMGIRTESTLAKECRQGVMEFLLINHPLDCPICDQAGECSLQEYSVQHGNGGSRFLEQKVKKPKNVSVGPRVRLDDERCIMCSRCIRFSREVVEDDCLGFTDRGSHTVLAVNPGKELANNYSLNTVDICPVGALTSEDFRFQMRVWFLKETESICTSCGRGCNVTMGAREGKLYRMTPRENNDVNSTWMCDSGRLDFHYLNSESRLTDPMIKDGETHKATDWPEAIRRAGEGLLKYKGEQLAIVASGRMTNEEMFMVRKLAEALECKTIDIVARNGEADEFLVAADKNPNTNGAIEILKVRKPGSKLANLRRKIDDGVVKAVLVLGENLIKAGFEEATLKKLKFLCSSHILANPTAQLSDVVLPGTASEEKRGSMINVTGRLQRLNQAAQPPANAMEDWEILKELNQCVSASDEFDMLEDVFKALSEKVKAFKGLTLGKIGPHGVPLIETEETIPMLEKERARQEAGLIVG